MARLNDDSSTVNARIVYWGVEGAGKTANLHMAHSRLRPDHREEVRAVSSPSDPTVSYEELSITLGEVAGTRTQIEMVSVPGRADQRPLRELLLEAVAEWELENGTVMYFRVTEGEAGVQLQIEVERPEEE